MKKIVLLLAFLSVSQLVSSQTEFASKRSDVNIEEKKKLNEYFDAFEVITFDVFEFKKLLRNKEANLSIRLNSNIIKDFNLELEPNDILTKNSVISMTKDKVVTRMEVKEVNTYKGMIDNDKNQWVRLYSDDKVFYAFFHTKNGEDICIEPISNYTHKADDKNRYVIFDINKFKKEGNCGIDLLKEAINKPTKPNSSRVANPWNPCRIIPVAVEGDFEWYQTYGGNSWSQIYYVMNVVDGIYQNQFNLRVTIPYINVYTTNTDPYNATDSQGLLTEFRNHWQNNLGGISRTLAHLFTGKMIDGGNGFGIAWLGVVCSNSSLSYGLTASQAPQVKTTPHEIGHNLSATHDAGPCTNFIMCQGFHFASTFSQQSINEINNHLNSSDYCLENGYIASMYIDGNIILPYSYNNVNLYNWYNFYAPGNHNISWSVQNSGASAYVVYTNSNNSAVISSSSIEGSFDVKASKSNSCGVIDRYYSFYASNGNYYRVYPNPATDVLSIEIKKFDKIDELPDSIELFDEKSTNSVKYFKPKEMFERKELNEKIEINVKDLKRGTYYLHIQTNKNKEKPKEIIRVILM